MAKRILGRSYWLPAAVTLTSTASEVKTGTTGDAKLKLDVLGGITNLLVSTLKLRDLSGRMILSDEYLPLFSLLGKRDAARNIYYWPRPLQLDRGNQLEVEVKNDPTAPEAAGHIVFVGVPDEPPQIEIEGLETLGHTHVFSIDSGFTGSAADLSTRRTPEQGQDFVVHGAYTDLASALIRIHGVDNEAWQNDWTPVWAVASRAASQMAVNFWPRPYLIPKGQTLTFDFLNPAAEASGKIYLFGQVIER